MLITNNKYSRNANVRLWVYKIIYFIHAMHILITVKYYFIIANNKNGSMLPSDDRLKSDWKWQLYILWILWNDLYTCSYIKKNPANDKPTPSTITLSDLLTPKWSKWYDTMIQYYDTVLTCYTVLYSPLFLELVLW